MALFGSLGKALGLDSAQGRGFVTGLATKVSEEIDRDMQSTEENISRLTQLRLERAARDEKTNRETERSVKKEIEKMRGELQGSTDAVQYLIDNYGFEQAKTISSNLFAQQQSLGIDPLDDIGLEQRSGRSVTVDELVKFNTPMTSLTPISSLKGGVAVGFGKMFGGEEAAMARLEKMTDAEAEAYGIEIADGEEALKGMPPALQGNLKPYMLGRLTDAGDESKRLRRIAAGFLAKGNKEEAEALKLEADALYVIDTVGKNKAMTIGEVNATSKIFDGKLAQRFGLKVTLTEDGFIVDPAEDEAKKDEYLKTSGKIMDIVSQYVLANGVSSYPKAFKTVSEAMANNQNIVYVPPTEGGMGRIEVAEGKLFNPATEEINNGANDVDTAAAAASTEQTATTEPTVSKLEVELMNTQPGSAKAETIINKLMRQNPNYKRPQGY